jgi:predicted DNA-binding protein
METQLIVRIDKGKKQKFAKIARMEGKTASTKVRELVDSYIEANDFARVVTDIWYRISKKLKEKGITEADVKRVIKEARAALYPESATGQSRASSRSAYPKHMN